MKKFKCVHAAYLCAPVSVPVEVSSRCRPLVTFTLLCRDRSVGEPDDDSLAPVANSVTPGCLCLTKARLPTHVTTPSYYMGAEDPDSGPHAVHQTLPIVPSHQTLIQRWGSGNIPKSVLPGTDKE